DDRAGVPVLVGDPLLLGDLEMLVGPQGVLDRLQEREDRRTHPPVEGGAVQELEAPLQPPQPEEQIAERPKEEKGEGPLGVEDAAPAPTSPAGDRGPIRTRSRLMPPHGEAPWEALAKRLHEPGQACADAEEPLERPRDHPLNQ